MARDALDEQIAKRAQRNPRYPQMVQEAIARQDRQRQGALEGEAVVERVDPAQAAAARAVNARRNDKWAAMDAE